jgi:hypothetical protein
VQVVPVCTQTSLVPQFNEPVAAAAEIIRVLQQAPVAQAAVAREEVALLGRAVELPERR